MAAQRLAFSGGGTGTVLRALTVVTTHPSVGDAEPLPPAELVSVLLDGIRAVTGGAT